MHACQIAGLSRAAYYKRPALASERDAEVIDALNAIVTLHGRWDSGSASPGYDWMVAAGTRKCTSGETFAKSSKLFGSVIFDLFVSYRVFFGQLSSHEPGITPLNRLFPVERIQYPYVCVIIRRSAKSLGSLFKLYAIANSMRQARPR